MSEASHGLFLQALCMQLLRRCMFNPMYVVVYTASAFSSSRSNWTRRPRCKALDGVHSGPPIFSSICKCTCMHQAQVGAAITGYKSLSSRWQLPYWQAGQISISNFVQLLTAHYHLRNRLFGVPVLALWVGQPPLKM